MSGIKTTKTPLPATKTAVAPKTAREEAPVVWPSVVGGAAAYVSYPETKDTTQG